MGEQNEMEKLVSAREVLAMFCGDCVYRGEPEESPICRACDYRYRIYLAADRSQRSDHKSEYKRE